MRVRILKHLISIFGSMEPGTVHNIPDNTAESWCKAGIAMQDKSLDSSKEVKKAEKKRRRPSKKAK